jgi:hypothetical protein
MICFEVDRGELAEFGVVVPGRVHQVTIRLGSVFTSLGDASPSSLRIKMQVDGIVAYGHSLEDVPAGMTGELKLIGDGGDKLFQMTCPFNCVGAK